MKKFKDAAPGVWRETKTGVCIVKLKEPTEEFNAVYITSGTLIKKEPDEEVSDF